VLDMGFFDCVVVVFCCVVMSTQYGQFVLYFCNVAVD